MRWTCLLALAACAVPEPDTGVAESQIANNQPFANPLGAATTFSTAGAIDTTSTFYDELGTNGRDCGTCHQASQGWSISAEGARERFRRTNGRDPLFRPVDGAVSPDADLSTRAAQLAAYKLLLDRGVFRVGIAMPADAEFELVGIEDPYGHASATELSLFRRPLPSANLAFIPAVMWDGRVANVDIHSALLDQANGASLGHAQAAGPIEMELREEIVDFESSLYTAQLETIAGRLDEDGAHGGAEWLASQPMEAAPFNCFSAWANSPDPKRRAIARGQELFNTKLRPDGRGPCRGCHSVANVGTSASGLFADIGVSAAPKPSRRHLTTRDLFRRPAAEVVPFELPIYRLRNKVTGEIRRTTDPGRALITGKWSDVDRFKVPQLRALAARAPYFHNGSAATLRDVVIHYEKALGFQFTELERFDLVAFLSAL